MQCSSGHVSEVYGVRDVTGGYDWLCEKCGTSNFVHTTRACQFVGFYHEHLGHQPVYIDSWKTYRRNLEKLGAKNVLAS